VVLRGSDGLDSKKINRSWVQKDRKYRVRLSFLRNEVGIFTGKQLQEGKLRVSLSPIEQEIMNWLSCEIELFFTDVKGAIEKGCSILSLGKNQALLPSLRGNSLYLYQVSDK
jgi:hypothetical protein